MLLENAQVMQIGRQPSAISFWKWSLHVPAIHCYVNVGTRMIGDVSDLPKKNEFTQHKLDQTA